MVQSTLLLKSILHALTRGAIGFLAGIVVAWLALMFLGQVHGHSDFSQPELERELRGRWLALYIACGAAAFTMFVGKIRVSTYWLWFSVAFGIICVIPFWPHNGRSLLPFGSPYVNSGFHVADAIILAIHVYIALGVASIIHRRWPNPRLPMTATNVLEEWFADQRDQHLDVTIAGRIFGGRHGESMQQPRAYDFDGSVLQIRFAITEQLTVDNPSGFQRGEYGQLIIPHATRAVFRWHSYGRDQAPENWCEEIYESTDDRIQLTRTGPLMPGEEEEFQYSGGRFIELR
ncbi:MAG: hypothetical protein ACYTG0_30940 [Planctomycetota bacterium]|jgi:hypothetical protein